MNVVILGAGGHGRVVLDILREAGGVNVRGFIDADPGRVGQSVDGVAVLGPVNLVAKLKRQYEGLGVVVAIGDNRVRASHLELVAQAGLELVNAVHPSAVVSRTAVLGLGVVVSAGAVIAADARVGDGTIINTSAVVDHECRVGRAAHVCPGALLAGRVEVGDRAFVGLGAKVLPCLKVGADAVVGAGAVVIEDVEAGVTVAGVPARVLRKGSA